MYSQFLKSILYENKEDPDFAASDLGLHHLPLSHKKDASLIFSWVNTY